MTASKTSVPACAAFAIGVALWIIGSLLTGRREPWDVKGYWAVVYPLAVLACGLLGYAYPNRAWRWALLLFESQFIGMCIRNGELGSLWPLSMAVFAIIALPGMLVATIASRISSSKKRKRLRHLDQVSKPRPTVSPTSLDPSGATHMTEIEFQADGRRSTWWGYGDYYCDTPDTGPRIFLPYEGEPAHGDSYHKLIIDAKSARGYVWCGYFLWSKCGRFFTCDWLEGMNGDYQGGTWVFTQVLRATIIVEPRELRYQVRLRPERNEMHKILDENGEDALWEVLLSTQNDQWEAFR